MTLAPDSRFGSYVINNLLGVGLSSEVYRCRDSARGRDVALKIFQPESGREGESRAGQFQHEALIVGSLRHPNIVELYESGVENGVHYIVYEFLDGKSLNGPLAPPELTTIAAQIASGIMAMHNAGIVHSDLKPGNLIRTTDGRVKIIDFGIAEKFTSEMIADPQRLTEWRMRVRLDQLAFGLVLYQLATGKAPFEDSKTAAAMSELLGNQLLPLPPETLLSMQDAVRHCAATDGDHAGLLLTAMSVALSLAGAPFPHPEI